jgi:hypothetical protein
MEIPGSKDIGKHPEHSINWYQELCFKNIKNSLTQKGAIEWSSNLDVALDVEQRFQRDFLRTTFGNPEYDTPLTPDQETALKNYKDQKTPAEISQAASNIADRLERNIAEDNVDPDYKPSFVRKIDAAKRVSLYFDQEAQRRKTQTPSTS